jgi:glycosyltransferase involved in cell wall biosynthesis
LTPPEMPSVLLLKGLADPAHPSMLRFGSELELALRACDGVSVRESVTLAPMRLGRIEPYAARYIRAPLSAASRRRVHGVFHITDQSLGHLAAITPAARTVISCHDLMLLRARENTAGFRARSWSVARFAWSTGFLRRVACVVCTTESIKSEIVRLRDVAPERIRVVPHGVSSRFRPLDAAHRERVRQQLGLPGPGVLHVTSGQPYKNVEATLRVISRVRAAGVNATLLRVGRPLSRGQRRLADELRLGSAVRELGALPDERLVEMYGAADTLLFPSHAEGFGWPVLEAMACATPVVTSEDPALVEVAGPAGLRAAADDVAGLATSVLSVLDDRELADRLRVLGRERALGYSWRRAAQGYAAVYRMVA